MTTTTMTKTMRAIKVVGLKEAEIQEVPLPKLRDDYVLCKVNQMAVNPTDWKHIDFLGPTGTTVGCDFAGVIEEVGPRVTKDWKKGDRIAAFVHGCNAVELEDGCFAEYAVAKGDLQMKIPEGLSDEQAATLGVGITTVGQALYQSLGLPLQGRKNDGTTLLVYGGSTATGSLAIQFAVRSGYTVITTCSPRNFTFVKSLGASKAFNYKDAGCGKKIREYTNNELTLAFDTISEGSSPEICCDAISSKGGKISYLLPVTHSRDDVKSTSTLAYTITGEGFNMGPTPVAPKPEDLEFGSMFWESATKLFAEKQIVAHPTKACGGGLEGVFDGLQQVREGKVSRKKLVYKFDEMF
ncbi:hypothetical protein MMC27_004132 [Xylographa pallens]|nr:hypothetical protein [Xylographa pallens]